MHCWDINVNHKQNIVFQVQFLMEGKKNMKTLVVNIVLEK